mmetsp:Transcript_21410/g.32343  ORF Transcript_21410/g.32343 Transcript_21410/m.32343 type:complete len:112 (+) Transcript_21410:59-394(+)
MSAGNNYGKDYTQYEKSNPKFHSNYGPFKIPKTSTEAKTMLPNLSSNLYNIKRNHITKRKQEQNAKILSLESSRNLSDLDKAKIIRRIKKAETIKRTFQKLGDFKKFNREL